MKLSIFKLAIKKFVVTALSSSSKAMRLIWFIAHHSIVVVFVIIVLNLDLNIGKLFNCIFLRIKWNWIISILFDNFINVNWPNFKEFLTRFSHYLRFLIENCLNLLFHLIFSKILRLVWILLIVFNIEVSRGICLLHLNYYNLSKFF